MNNKSTVIIGGGFSGVACARELLKQGARNITIVEGEERLGGLAFYFTHEGRRIHTGYHQILESDTALVDLIRELGLYERVAWKKTKNKVFVEGRIYDLLNPLDFARFPLGPVDKARFAVLMARCYATRSWAALENVSADEWIASIAGRRVLEREPHLLTKEPTLLDRRVIFGPIAVTNPESSAGLPDAVDLIDESRAAFSTLEKRERHDFDFGTWKFSARAVRAIGQECVTCHHDRAVGDPLGVVLYAYRSRN